MTEPDVRAVVDGLLTHPERYVPSPGTYADGYLDALIDVLAGLGLVHPAASYAALREELAAEGRRITMRELYRQVVARAGEQQPPYDVEAGLARLRAWMEQDLALADGTVTGRKEGK